MSLVFSINVCHLKISFSKNAEHHSYCIVTPRQVLSLSFSGGIWGEHLNVLFKGMFTFHYGVFSVNTNIKLSSCSCSTTPYKNSTYYGNNIRIIKCDLNIRCHTLNCTIFTINIHNIFYTISVNATVKCLVIHSSKYLLLCWTEERNSYRFGTKLGRVSDDLQNCHLFISSLSSYCFEKVIWQFASILL